MTSGIQLTNKSDIRESTATVSPGFYQHLRKLWQSEFLSPKDLVRRAIVIALIFSLAHLLGLREFTSVINGTTGSTETSWAVSAFFGLSYVMLYLAAILLCPTLIIAAILLSLWNKRRRKSVGAVQL